MESFVIVSFVSKDFPRVFQASDWPLHVTLVRPFFSNWSVGEWNGKLQTICSDEALIIVRGGTREMFGPKFNIPVTLLEPVTELESLHDRIIAECQEGITFGNKLFQTYRPHAADTKSRKVEVRQEVLCDSTSLILRVGSSRQVVGTWDLLS